MHNDIPRICKRCIAAGHVDEKDGPLLYKTKTCPFGVDEWITLYLFSSQIVDKLHLLPCEIDIDNTDELVLKFLKYTPRMDGTYDKNIFSVNADFIVGIQRMVNEGE